MEVMVTEDNPQREDNRGFQTPSAPFSQEVPQLLQKHLDHLLASAISLEVIRERGYTAVLGKSQPIVGLGNKTLAALGVKVYSHQEPYLDPRLPFYESIIAFLADIARWERERLSERTKAGLRRAVALGKRFGLSQRGERPPKKGGQPPY